MSKVKTKNMFSTITFQNGNLDKDIIKNLLEYIKNESCYLLIEETGAYGKNNHLHLYIELKKARRTDHFSLSIKKLYSDKSYHNRYTVKTLSENDKIYRIGYYLQKEPDSIKHGTKAVDLFLFKAQYIARETTAQKLLIRKNRRQYTINELPSLYMARCNADPTLTPSNFEKNYMDMYRDGLITTTQLKSLRWVTVGIKALQGIELPSQVCYIQEN